MAHNTRCVLTAPCVRTRKNCRTAMRPKNQVERVGAIYSDRCSRTTWKEIYLFVWYISASAWLIYISAHAMNSVFKGRRKCVLSDKRDRQRRKALLSMTLLMRPVRVDKSLPRKGTTLARLQAIFSPAYCEYTSWFFHLSKQSYVSLVFGWVGKGQGHFELYN